MKEKDKNTRGVRDSDRHGRRPINKQGMRDQTDGQGESAKIGLSTMLDQKVENDLRPVT